MSELALWQYIFIAMWLVTWAVFSVVWWRGRKRAGKTSEHPKESRPTEKASTGPSKSEAGEQCGTCRHWRTSGCTLIGRASSSPACAVYRGAEDRFVAGWQERLNLIEVLRTFGSLARRLTSPLHVGERITRHPAPLWARYRRGMFDEESAPV